MNRLLSHGGSQLFNTTMQRVSCWSMTSSTKIATVFHFELLRRALARRGCTLCSGYLFHNICLLSTLVRMTEEQQSTNSTRGSETEQ